jgi:hypothetical protein
MGKNAFLLYIIRHKFTYLKVQRYNVISLIAEKNYRLHYNYKILHIFESKLEKKKKNYPISFNYNLSLAIYNDYIFILVQPTIILPLLH